MIKKFFKNSFRKSKKIDELSINSSTTSHLNLKQSSVDLKIENEYPNLNLELQNQPSQLILELEKQPQLNIHLMSSDDFLKSEKSGKQSEIILDLNSLKKSLNLNINQNDSIPIIDINSFSTQPRYQLELPNEINENEKTIEKFSVCAEKNYPKRRTMEDTHVIKEILYEYNGHIVSLFCIFDGHGGRQASLKAEEIVCEIMKNALIHHNFDTTELMKVSNDKSSEEYENEFKKINETFQEIMNEVSLEMDRKISEETTDKSGCTALFCLIDKKEDKRIILMSNIGDSLGSIFTETGFIPMSIEHRPNNQEEIERITDLGGIIFNGRVNGVLAVSRALGDKEMKPYVSQEAFCSVIPYENHMKYIVLGCDGLWDYVSHEKVFEFLKERENNFDRISHDLTNFAIKNKSTDNISIIILKL